MYVPYLLQQYIVAQLTAQPACIVHIQYIYTTIVVIYLYVLLRRVSSESKAENCRIIQPARRRGMGSRFLIRLGQCRPSYSVVVRPLRQSFRFLCSSNVATANVNKSPVPEVPSSSSSSSPSSSSKQTSRKTKEERLAIKREYSALPPINVHHVMPKIREAMWAKFDETIEVVAITSLDPRKPNQSVKGIAQLPHGTGKAVRVAVFAEGPDAQAAVDAGADIVGSDDLIRLIQGGKIDFQRCIATPDLMSSVSKIGKILGPRGLMPNPKLGTVTREVAKAIKEAKAGSVQFKVERKGIIMAGIGKASFTDEMILENLKSFMVAITDSKPEGFKGKYLKRVHMSSTMGPGLEIDLSSVDPSNSKFMIDPSKY